MKRKAQLLTIALLVILAGTATAEVFRTRRTVLLQLPEAGSADCAAGINDAVAIRLPDDTTFLQAIELEIRIPEVIAQYRGAVAYSLYTDVSPEPSEGRIDYSGSRDMIDTLPGRLSLSVTVPLLMENTLKQSPYTTILPFVHDKDKAIFLRFQLVMKGIPESFDDETLSVTAKPIYVDKGRLVLDMKYPLGQDQKLIEKPYSVFVDEAPVVPDGGTVILDTGIHHLSIVSDFYRNETRTFTVEQAQSTSVQIQLRDITPTLQLVVPEGTAVFLDGNQLKDTSRTLVIEQGEHSVRFSVGGYEVTRNLQAVNGRSYTVSLTIGVDVAESQ